MKNDETRWMIPGGGLVALMVLVCAVQVRSAEPKAAPNAAAKATTRVMPWVGTALAKVPPVHATTERPAKGLRALFYEGADYKGKPTWVFAYYSAPQGTPPAGGWPAVVCAHGGGGTAYPNWVKNWNSHGYAAIAMDLEGHLPGGNAHGVEGNPPLGAAHANAGPARQEWFGDVALPDTEQWFYHAVADVIRANSLLRSFPEINPKKIGLTGISWGGTIVSAVAGVDARFAFVVPVYGCGFIHKHNMTPEQYSQYLAKWDPSAHLPFAKMPMLWVNGVADPVFHMDVFAKSAKIAGGPSSMCLRPFLAHGHGNGWEDAPEIVTFADSIVKGGPPLPKLERPEINPATGMVHTKYKGEFTEAWIYCTTSGGPWKDRKWNFIQCNLAKAELISQARLPQGTTAYFVYGFRTQGGGRNNHAASELVVPIP
jgi:dienelactone hydrolase